MYRYKIYYGCISTLAKETVAFVEWK